MKKQLAYLSILMSFIATAQDVTTTTSSSIDDDLNYNKWSIELNGGVNKALATLTPGYATANANLFHADLGVRYMMNPKFGLKLDFGYDQFQECDDAPEFESTYMRTSLQGVINLGRVLNFETWTNTFGLLAHGGFGVSQLTSDKGFEGEDYMGHGIAGLTAQIRLSERMALTGDLTGIINGKQNYNFDGMSPTNSGAFDGAVMNMSLGLTFYLGKHSKHADWVAENADYASLEKRVALLEKSLQDTDKDGVADLYDIEPNTLSGAVVNTKGQAIDLNKNGVPDDIEDYINKKYGSGDKTITNNSLEELINDGYVNVYFDFNSTKPTNSSLSGVDFVTKYLKSNPSKSVDIIGYADEIGSSSYNQELSKKRAESVKNIIVNSGIDASRLNVIGSGEDTSVNKNSKEARQIVRRVSFKVK